MASEAPIVIENRKELAYLLCQAAELEHGLMCEYLYAAFSLKDRPGPGLTPAYLAAVQRWREVLLAIAKEEMLHWALVNNLLTAVGSAPYVSRPRLSGRLVGYPAGVQLALLPFGERALRHFVYLERPEGTELADAEGSTTAPVRCRRCARRTWSRPLRSSLPSATCTARSTPGWPTWPADTASGACSSGRPGPRPPRRRSAGPTSSR